MVREQLIRAVAVIALTLSPMALAEGDSKSSTAQASEQTPILIVHSQDEWISKLQEMIKIEVERQLKERLASMIDQERKMLLRLIEEFRDQQEKNMKAALNEERVARAKDILAALEKLNALDIALHKEIREQDKELAVEREERIKLEVALRDAIAKNDAGLIEGILRWLGRKVDTTIGTTAKAA